MSCDWADLQFICVKLVVFRCIVPLRALRNELITKLSNVMPHVRTLILLCSHSVSQDVVATTITNILVCFPELTQLCLQRAFEDKIRTIAHPQMGSADSHTRQLFAGSDTIGHSLFHSTIQNCPAHHTLGLSSRAGHQAAPKEQVNRQLNDYEAPSRECDEIYSCLLALCRSARICHL